MILSCPACETRYQVDAAKFPPVGRTVRCARCGNVWHATGESEISLAPPPRPEPVAPASAPPVAEAYAQPIARDPEPQTAPPDEEIEHRTPAVPLAERLQRLLIPAGWAALAGVVLLIGFVAAAYRHQVVEAWPQTASVYSKLGMKVTASGLKIADTKFSRDTRLGQPVLTVSGALTNVADRELPVPQIRIGLVDRDAREVYHWMVAPDVIALKPGQSTRFVTRLSNPPDEAVNYRVEFAKAGE